jgi:hypothetical protein
LFSILPWLFGIVFDRFFSKKPQAAEKTGKKDAKQHYGKGIEVCRACMTQIDCGKIDRQNIDDGIGGAENDRSAKTCKAIRSHLR